MKTANVSDGEKIGPVSSLLFAANVMLDLSNKFPF